MAAPACCTRAAAIAAPRSTTARSRKTASAAATTAGNSTPKAIASSSPASPRAASSRTRCASPGTRFEERYGLIFAYMGPAREKAGAAALRVPGKDGRRRIRRGRRQLDRRRRAGRHPLQLAAAFRERGRPLPRAGAARLVQRAAIHQHDGLDARGEVRDVAARRHRALDPQPGRRQDVLPGDRSRPPHPARRAQSAGRAIRPRRVDRLDAADRRHFVPHLCRRPGQEVAAISGGCARNSTASSGGT